jgi:hypothetical protein
VIAGASGRVITGAGDQLHARGSFASGEKNFGVFRSGQVFVDPDTGEILGKEAIEIGGGRLIAEDNGLGTLSIERSNKEIRTQDRLLPVMEQKITATFYPSAPQGDVSGVILAVEGGVANVGRLDVVVLNRGAREGLAEGNVLAIKKAGEVVRDPVTKRAGQAARDTGGRVDGFPCVREDELWAGAERPTPDPGAGHDHEPVIGGAASPPPSATPAGRRRRFDREVEPCTKMRSAAAFHCWTCRVQVPARSCA